MKIGLEEVLSAREWAEKNAGEDDPLDVYEWKLLEMLRDGHDRSAAYHVRKFQETETHLAVVGDRFKTEDEPDEF